MHIFVLTERHRLSASKDCWWNDIWRARLTGEGFRSGSRQVYPGAPFSAATNSPEEPFGMVIVRLLKFIFFESPVPASHFLVVYQPDLKILRWDLKILRSELQKFILSIFFELRWVLRCSACGPCIQEPDLRNTFPRELGFHTMGDLKTLRS